MRTAATTESVNSVHLSHFFSINGLIGLNDSQVQTTDAESIMLWIMEKPLTPSMSNNDVCLWKRNDYGVDQNIVHCILGRFEPLVSWW